MASPVPPAHYDSPWKLALTRAFRAFIAFFFAEIHAQIDWSKRPRFRDKELAQIGFGDHPSGMAADMLVEVWLRDGAKRWVLVHVEVQAQRDVALARRVLDYNYRIFDEHGLPVASLVLLADNDPEWRPDSFYNEVLGTVMGISFATAKLLDDADQAEALLASHNPFALVTLAHLRTQQTRHDPDQLYAAKWELTKLLFQQGWSKRRIIVLFRVINWMMALPGPLQLRYRRAVQRWERRKQMEWLDPFEESLVEKGWQRGHKVGRERGREEGRETGREEGRKEGAAELLERQLTQRFGELPPTYCKKLAKASGEQLVAWGAALLDAQSLKEVFK
jgi:hypothetical protein